MGLLLPRLSIHGNMKMAKDTAGVYIFSSYVLLEVSFTSYGTHLVTCSSLPAIALSTNKVWISSKQTRNGTGNYLCLINSFVLFSDAIKNNTEMGLSLFLSTYFVIFCRDNFLILHACMAAMAYYAFPFLRNLQIWNWRGGVYALLLHIGVSEPLYYWVHRRLHVGSLFTDYHSQNHSSVVTQSYTGKKTNKKTISSLFL